MDSNPFRYSQSVVNAFPSGPLRNDLIEYIFIIYYLPKPKSNPLVLLDELLTSKFNSFQRADSLNENETVPTLTAWVSDDAQRDCAPPDSDWIELFNHGVNSHQAVALQTTQVATILNFCYPSGQSWNHLRAALRFTSELAAATGGLIWDYETREILTPTAWNTVRIDGWTDYIPDVSNHIIVQAYRNEDQMRVITLGMKKFGLPDVAVNQVPPSATRNIVRLVNTFCQAIVDQPLIKRTGEFDLDLQLIKPDNVGIAPLTIKKGVPEEGDSENRLLEITFDRGSGHNIDTRRHAIIASAFGFETALVPTLDDDAISAVRHQIEAKLPALRALFNEELPSGEFVQVKAPFFGPDGAREWMWVEVATWTGDKITGTLSSDPLHIPHLHVGQPVKVSQSTIIDYLYQRGNGTIEGGNNRLN